jgi:hypothetical protein
MIPAARADAAKQWMEAGRHITHRDRTEPMRAMKGAISASENNQKLRYCNCVMNLLAHDRNQRKRC